MRAFEFHLVNATINTENTEKSARGRSASRVVWIDAARGVAAIGVMLHHYLAMAVAREPDFMIRYFGAALSDFYKHNVDFGVFGVALFFLISGYIVPASAMGSSPQPVARFWTGRIFRLFPAYWVSVVLALVILGGKPLAILANFTMLQRFLGQPDLLGLYWTLQVELIFYALVSILIARRLLDRPVICIVGAAVFLLISVAFAAIRFYAGIKSPLAPVLGLSWMFAGNFWYWFASRKAFSARQAVAFYAVFLPCVYLISFLGYHRDWGYLEEPARYIVSYTAALAVFLVFSRTVRGEMRTLVYLGAISYSLYLFHEIVMFLLWDRLASLGGWSQIAICSVVTIIVAAITFRWIEQPGIAAGKAIVKRNGWANPKPAAVAA